MKLNIICLSNTGNNKHLAFLFQCELQKLMNCYFVYTDVNMFLNKQSRASISEFEDSDGYIFTTYTQNSRLPLQFAEFIKLIPKNYLLNKPIIALNAHGNNKGLLKEDLQLLFKNYYYLGCFQTKYIDNIHLKSKSTITTISNNFLPELKIQAEKFINSFVQIQITQQQPSFLNKLLLQLPRFLPQQSLKFDNCSNCTKCINLCPFGLIIQENQIYKLKSQKSCTMCLNCVLNCPEQAIHVITKKGELNIIQYKFHPAYLQTTSSDQEISTLITNCKKNKNK